MTINGRYVYPSLIVIVLIGSIIARLAGVLIPLRLMELWNPNGRKLIKWNETILIAIGGVIKGAIAFGLAMQMRTENYMILKTTT